LRARAERQIVITMTERRGMRTLGLISGCARTIAAVALILGVVSCERNDPDAGDAMQPPVSDACAAYAATLASGALVGSDSQDRALYGIHSCPAAVRGPALAAAFQRRRRMAYIFLHQGGAFLAATRDPVVFRTLVDIVDDGSASPAARATSIMVLLAMIDTVRGPTNTDVFMRPSGEYCFAYSTPITPSLPFGPLPRDSARAVLSALIPLARSSSTDSTVRATANCALVVLRRHGLS
jgi:hypothetical protein